MSCLDAFSEQLPLDEMISVQVDAKETMSCRKLSSQRLLHPLTL